ncbi:MAG: DEAD/DEAH box helicase [Candidatus Aenigmarchaeota archaeon]|nr:DEAD/DEAH box helicase [Candidatus Aenigmarchaeota archaeon]
MPEKEIIQKILDVYDLKDLNPMQKLATKGDFFERNVVISAPTASGKTLCADFLILKTILQKKKSIYIVPLVSLANEKYQTFKEKYEKLGFKVAISVGDLDSADPWLANYDIIVATTEKLDSLIRHSVPWLKETGLIVVDEIHLLNDTSRGPTLEILITNLKEIIPRTQILGLSATIKNSHELAKWLNASLVISDYRPVKLYEGVAFDSKIFFYGKNGYELSKLETDAAIVENTLNMNKQVLIFVSTRRSAEKLAEDLTKLVRLKLPRSQSFELETISDQALYTLDNPTRQCKKLAACLKNGTAFHHAGLLGKQRRLIEDEFRKGLVKVIVATPTLALGVNLPAFRVVIKDVKRFYSGIGAMYIPVLEYKQFVGRAGRPQYDEFGESILIARSEEDAQDLTDHFIMGEPEDIRSKLAMESALRMHTLSLISSEFVKSEKTLLEFFAKTFYAFQYGEMSMIEEQIQNILDNLIEWGFIISKNNKLATTKIGKRVSELYVDPMTAHKFIECLHESAKKDINHLSFLQTICHTDEMKPFLNVRTSETTDIYSFITKEQRHILEKIPEEWDLEFDDFLKSIKTAMMFEEWLNEASEDEILAKFRVAPGELRNRLKNADWLLYSINELALLLGMKGTLKEVRKVRVRLMYGVREELLPLVKLKNIGRARARKLFNSGLKSLEDLRKVPIESLSVIVGRKVAESVKNQLEGKESKDEKQATLKKY